MKPGWLSRNGLFWIAVAGSAAFSMSTLFSAMKPVLVTRFAEELGHSASLNGLIAAAPFIGIAFSALLVNWVLRHFRYRDTVLAAGLFLIVAELVNAFFFDALSLLFPMQLLAGISVGILMGVTANIISVSRYPHQMFGIVDMVCVLLMSLMISGVGMSVEYSGLHGGFIFAAVVALLFMLPMLVYENAGNKPLVQDKAPLKISKLPILVILMGVLFVTFSGLGFTHMFTKAISLGLGYDEAGQSIGLILFFSALVCPLGGIISARYGVYLPLLVAYICCAVGWYFAMFATSVNIFLVSLIPATFALQFSFPILLGLSGSLDKEGKWASIATPILTSGFAWAAVLAGWFYQIGGLPLVILASKLGIGLCTLLLLVIYRAQKQGEPRLSSS